MSTTLIVLLTYMLIIVLIAVISTKRAKITKSEDYLLAGRNLGTFMLAGTLAAAEIGGGSTMGVSAKAFGDWGLSAGWYVLCSGLGILLVALVAPYLRRAMAATIPEILDRRYGKEVHFVTTVLALVSGVALTAAQIVATAMVISTVAGIDFQTAVILSAVVVTLYTMMGGLISVAYTDIIHISVIILGMMIALPLILTNSVDGAGVMEGWNKVAATLPQEQMDITKIGWKQILGLTLMYFMTFSTGQEAVQRYFAAKDEITAKKGSIICACFMGVYGFIPAVIGLVALAHFPNIDAGQALPTAAVNFLNPVMSGVVLAAICAATLSSAAGNMIAVGAVFTNDVYGKYIKKDASAKTLILASKLIILFTGAAGLIIAIKFKDIIPLLVIAFTIRSAGPFAALIFGLVYDKVTKKGAIFSVVIASIVAVVWEYLNNPYGIMSIIVGAITSVLVLIIVSKIDLAMGGKPAPSAFLDDNK